MFFYLVSASATNMYVSFWYAVSDLIKFVLTFYAEQWTLEVPMLICVDFYEFAGRVYPMFGFHSTEPIYLLEISTCVIQNPIKSNICELQE